jgi:hypothetical protein
MPAGNDSAVALAAQLRALPDDQLAELLEAREIHEPGIRDFFDLVEALLDPTSIQHALGRLERPALAVLAVLSESGTAREADAAARLEALGADTHALPEHLVAALRLALVTQTDGLYAVPASVRAQLSAWSGIPLPNLNELATGSPPSLVRTKTADMGSTDHLAAERAFGATMAILELVTELQHESARQLVRGGMSQPDEKRLASAMGVHLDRVEHIIEIAARAGLVVLENGRWMPTSTTTEWLVDSWGERWSLLAAAWLGRLPEDIRRILHASAHATWGPELSSYIDWLFPAGGEWMLDRISIYTRDAEMLGIAAHHIPSTPGAALLAHGPGPAAQAMAALFPPEVEQVYLQHDLSVVSPGPLAPRLDSRLRAMADVEGRALASTYRISTASLNRAMAGGETEASIREFLSEISLTGIPQPLGYLLSEATARYGLLRVGSIEDGPLRSYVRSTDATLLRTLLVDHGLAALGFARWGGPDLGPDAPISEGNHLASGVDLEAVFWALNDARYPVAAENAAGEVVSVQRRQTVRASNAPAKDPALTLIEKLRLGSSADPEVTGKAWLSRQIDLAIKSKAALTVTVQMPDGTAIDYQLEPASVGGGRLRARDRRADIERTLPMSSITAVSAAH